MRTTRMCSDRKHLSEAAANDVRGYKFTANVKRSINYSCQRRDGIAGLKTNGFYEIFHINGRSPHLLSHLISEIL